MANLSMTLWCQVANRYELLAYTEPGGCIEAALIANLAEAWTRDGQHRDTWWAWKLGLRASGCLWQANLATQASDRNN